MRFRGRLRNLSHEPVLALSLVRTMSGASQNSAREWFIQGKVHIEGRLCTLWKQAVQPGEEVSVDTDRRRPSRRPILSGEAVVFRDGTFCVVEKPWDLVSVPPTRTGELTVLDLLNDMSTSQGWNVLWKPLHRLDHGTSGLMVFGADGAWFGELQAMIRRHEVARRYLAVVWGRPGQTRVEGRLDVSRGPSASRRPESRFASARFRVLETVGEVSLVECEPETGRFHQLRRQLAQAGTPILGDPEWPVSNKVGRANGVPIRRLCLHSCHLTLTHPQRSQVMSWTSPLPDELQRFLRQV